MVRALILDNEARERVKALVDFASEEANWYRPTETDEAPGENPEFCVELNTYRCVFTFTVAQDGSIYRHLSMSVPTWKEGGLPRPEAFNEIAMLFGFPDMRSETHAEHQIAHNPTEGCIVAVFPVTRTD